VSGISAVGPGLDFDRARCASKTRFPRQRHRLPGAVDRPQNYAAIALKAVGSQFPQYAIDANQPTATVYFYGHLTLEFHLPVQTQFAAFEMVAREVSLARLPQDHQYSLARLAPGIRVTLAVMRANDQCSAGRCAVTIISAVARQRRRKRLPLQRVHGGL
jgi:hypothetical protein